MFASCTAREREINQDLSRVRDDVAVILESDVGYDGYVAGVLLRHSRHQPEIRQLLKYK
jgi:hypothetical protein